MADIRIKDLGTTASVTASDDFMAVDGTTNGTRKLSAAAPAFLTSVTTPSLTSPAATNLTLGLGTGGTALTLTNSTLAATFAGAVTISSSTSATSSAGAIVATGGVSAKNLFITAAIAPYDNTNPSIAFSSAGGALGFYSQSNTLYFASTAQRILGFTNTGLSFSINGDATTPNIATDAAGASGFFAPANGSIAYSGGGTERFRIAATTGAATFAGAVTVGGNVGFYNNAPVAKPTGVAVTAAAIHAALVTLNLIAA